MNLYHCEYRGDSRSASAFYAAKREGAAIKQFIEALAEDGWEIPLDEVSVRAIHEVDSYDVILMPKSMRRKSN